MQNIFFIYIDLNETHETKMVTATFISNKQGWAIYQNESKATVVMHILSGKQCDLY